LVGEDWRPRGFILAIGLILAIPLITPLVVQRGVKFVRVRGFGFFYGMKALGRELQTSPFAIAALAVAVAMMVGITIMVGSFRRTLEVWIDHTLQADIYITSQSWRRGARNATLEPGVVDALSQYPGVIGVDRLRQFFIEIGGRRVALSGVDADLPVMEHRFSLLAGEPKEAVERMWEDEATIIGEPLARKADLHVGDVLHMQGPRGEVSLPIAGIYYDYSSESGSALIALTTMEKYFGPGQVTNVALYLEPGRDPELVIDELKSRFSDVPLEIRSNRRLREQVFRIFEQTFAVTRLLQVMSLLIAVSGITLTLLVLAREKVPELALYRALGADRLQIFRTYLGKGLGIALAGLVLGGVGGAILAMILIFIINRAFFGWTIALYWPWTALAGEAVTILVASILGSIYPALSASRTPATELRRDDL
jgi:putative ABC transport system permease protein